VAGTPATEPAIALEGVGRRYGERVALADVSIDVPAGATLAVLGPNGAGKSTLLRLLATLLRPHAGRARLLGRTLPGEGWAVRGRVGLLGHEPMLYRDLTPRENLRYHAALHGTAAARIEEVLVAVAMERRGEEPVRTLSRGMVQRVAVCRAVLHDPEVLLLDEAGSHLDPAAAALVEPLIGRGAVRADGTPRTRVLSSHDVGGALEEADLVLGLRAGRPVLAGPAAEVDRRALEALYR
jgi:heme exporter protein A